MIKVGDIVRIDYKGGNPTWNGIEMRITKTREQIAAESKGSLVHFEGIVTYSPPDRANKNSVGSRFSWADRNGLVVIENHETPNAAYMEHIYERISSTLTKQEMSILAARIQAAATR